MVVISRGGFPAGAFAQPDEIFDADQPASQSHPHPQGHQMTELQPGEDSAVHAHPQRLTNDAVRFGGRIGGETQVEKVSDGQGGAGQGDEPQGEEAPARPDQRRDLKDEDQQYQPAPAGDHQEQRGRKVLTKGRRQVHRMNYTLRRKEQTRISPEGRTSRKKKDRRTIRQIRADRKSTRPRKRVNANFAKKTKVGKEERGSRNSLNSRHSR